MRKLLYISFLFFTLFFSCKNKDVYVVTCHLQNLTDSLVFVSNENSGYIDTIVCKNGRFNMEGSSDSLSHFSLYLQSTGTWLDVWAKNKEKISISGDAKYPELIEVRGNAANDKLSEFKSANRALIQEKANLSLQKEETASDSLNGSLDDASYASKISNINHQLREKAENFVRKNPTEPASVILLRDYLIDREDVNKIHDYLSLIQHPANSMFIYKQLDNLYQKMQATTIGSPAPSFEIVDIQNDTAKLQDFKGKYLLLTFAASWCDVCREDNKELVDIYNKFKNKGIRIFTVSFDENKKDWQKAAKEDKIEWRQAIDTHGWGAEMLDLYNITSIPSNFLIDENGVIVGKNLFGEDLEKTLEEKLRITN